MGSRPLELLLLVLRDFLSLDGEDQRGAGGGQQKQAEGAVLPHAVIAGDGEVGALGVDHGEGRLGVDGAVVGQHGDELAVDSGGGGQQVCAADLAEGVALPGGDDDLNGVPQQGVALGGVGLGDGVGIVLQTPDRQHTAVGVGDKAGGLCLRGR